jgi:FkbH-like protein
VTPFTEIDSSRIEQMFLRTNQFRANSRNWNDCNWDSQSSTYKLELSDKYANYGIVAILIFYITDDSLVISNWLMSCRVFGRNLENSFLSRIIANNLDKKLQYLKIDYEQSKRNSYFLKVCENLGFTIIEGCLSIEISKLNL